MASSDYDAFVSYSRGASASLALDLQRGIQKYAKPWNRLRAARVFRDDSNMSANPGLWSAIQAGLQSSEWFILVATPEAARSEYVDREVSWWVRNRGVARFLLVKGAGEFVWDANRSAFVVGSSSSIPPTLADAFEEEPRWVDMSWYHDSSDTSDPRFESAVADLSSAIRGIDRDDLVGENIREAKKLRRVTRLGVAALVVLLILSLAASVLAYSQRVEATNRREEAQDQANVATSRLLSAQSRIHAETDMQQALMAATSAFAMHRDEQTTSALHDAVVASPQLVAFRDAGAYVTATGGSSGGTVVAGTEDGSVLLWRSFATQRLPERIMTLKGRVTFVGLTISEDGVRVVASAKTSVKDPEYGLTEVVDTQTGVWTEGNYESLDYPVDAMSPSGRTLVAWKDWNPNVVLGSVGVVVHSSTGGVTQFHTGHHPSAIAVPDDKTIVTMDEYGNSSRIDVSSGRVRHQQVPMGTWMFGMDFSPDGKFFTYTNGSRDFSIWRMRGRRPNTVKEGRAPDADPVDIALSSRAARLETSTDGRIYVSDTRRTKGNRPRVLRGAGAANEGTLHFLGQDQLVSATRDSVTLWDVTRTARTSTQTSASIPSECGGCGPPQVAVDVTGKKVAVVSGFGDDVMLADLETMRTKRINHVVKTAGWDLFYDSTVTAVAWSGKDLLAYSAGAQQLLTVPGPNYDSVAGVLNVDLGYLNVPDQYEETPEESALVNKAGEDVYRSAASYPDFAVNSHGHVIAASGTEIFDLDPQAGTVDQLAFPGGHLNSDGSAAVLVEQKLDAPGQATPRELWCTTWLGARRSTTKNSLDV